MTYFVDETFGRRSSIETNATPRGQIIGYIIYMIATLQVTSGFRGGDFFVFGRVGGVPPPKKIA